MRAVLARTKTMMLGALAVVAMTAAFPPTRAEAAEDRCARLAAIDNDKLHRALVQFSGKVMGKHPEHWTRADYANLIANAAACDGLPANVRDKIDGRLWGVKLRDAQKQNAEVSSISLAIARAYGEYWDSNDEFPACATFLEWKRDDVWFTNNSKDLFGRSFIEMREEELALYRRLAEACRPAMEKILERWRIDPDTAALTVDSITESIDMDAAARKENPEALPKALQVHHAGRRVPLSYLRATTREVVRRILEVENSDRVMPASTLIRISRWAKQVMDNESAGPDRLYAERIRGIVSEHMFRAADSLWSPGEASAGP